MIIYVMSKSSSIGDEEEEGWRQRRVTWLVMR